MAALLLFLKYHDIEEILKLGKFEIFETCLLTHESHEDFNIMETGKDFRYEEGTTWFHTSIGLTQEFWEIRTHKWEREDGYV